MNGLKKILDLFGLEFHNCKFKNEELPKLGLIVNPNEKQMSVASVAAEFNKLPAVAFNVSILSGSEYANINIPDANGIPDNEGWDLFSFNGLCGYNHKNRTVYIGYPYPYGKEADLPIERAILHELGHYKQDILYGANAETCNGLILEYHNIMSNENKSITSFGKDSVFGIGNYRITYGEIKGQIDIFGERIIRIFSDKYPFRVQIDKLDYIINRYCDNTTTSIKVSRVNFNGPQYPQDLCLLREMENLINQIEVDFTHILFINMLNSLWKQGYLSYTK